MEIKYLTDLLSVLDLVHDRWFDLSQVKFDKASEECTLFLGEKRKGPFDDRVLKISGVLDVKISDEAGIGIYDLRDLIPEPSSSSIRITSGFPLELILKVKQTCEISILKPSEM